METTDKNQALSPTLSTQDSTKSNSAETSTRSFVALELKRLADVALLSALPASDMRSKVARILFAVEHLPKEQVAAALEHFKTVREFPTANGIINQIERQFGKKTGMRKINALDLVGIDKSIAESETVSTLPSIKTDSEGKKQLGEILKIIADGLQLYGKTPDQAKNAAKLFYFALGDYDIQRIREAFAYYVKSFKEFPTPSDIVNIIERGNKPPFERAVYVSISKKEAFERSTEEWNYMRDYERWTISGKN